MIYFFKPSFQLRDGPVCIDLKMNFSPRGSYWGCPKDKRGPFITTWSMGGSSWLFRGYVLPLASWLTWKVLVHSGCHRHRTVCTLWPGELGWGPNWPTSSGFLILFQGQPTSVLQNRLWQHKGDAKQSQCQRHRQDMLPSERFPSLWPGYRGIASTSQREGGRMALAGELCIDKMKVA